MNNKEIEEYLEKNYPFKAETNDTAKYENMLMAIRRTAFIDGANFVIKFVNKEIKSI